MRRLSKPAKFTFSWIVMSVMATLTADPLSAQGPPRRAVGDELVQVQPGRPFGRGRGRRNDPQFQADHEVFFFLLEHRNAIRRKVTKQADGVVTVTESNKPEVADQIRDHVASMYDRVENVNPIHMRDPLFREIFRHAKKIKMEMEETPQGVRVTETSEDPYVAELIKAHADVVSLFIKNGHVELHKNHALPKRSSNDANNEARPAD